MSKDVYDTGATRHSDHNGERYDLISPHALRRLSKVYAEGAASHGERNWEQGLPKESTIQHLLWHWNQYLAPTIPPITKEDHLAKVMWGIATLLHFEEVENPAEFPHEIMKQPSNNLQDAKRITEDLDEKYLKYGGV